MAYKLFWTEESINNLEDILDYLIQNWTQKEVISFKQKLKKQLELIAKFPRMFPVSDQNSRLRKAVLNKQITVYFEIRGEIIYIAYLFVNRRNIDRIK